MAEGKTGESGGMRWTVGRTQSHCEEATFSNSNSPSLDREVLQIGV